MHAHTSALKPRKFVTFSAYITCILYHSFGYSNLIEVLSFLGYWSFYVETFSNELMLCDNVEKLKYIDSNTDHNICTAFNHFGYLQKEMAQIENYED